MAKKQAFTIVGLTGSVTVTYYTGAIFAQGTLLELSDESVTLSVKRPRSSKRDMLTVALDRVTYASLSAEENEAYIAYRGEDSATFDGVTITQIVNGALMGTIGDDEAPFIAGGGTWTFTAEAVAEEAEKPAGKKKAPAAEVEPETEDDEEEEEEEEFEVGNVTVIDSDGEEVTTIKTRTAKKMVVVDEEEEEEFEVGNYVTVTDSDEEEVTGTIKTLTAKKLVVVDAEDETHTFKPDDVTVAHAEKPKANKKTAGKKPAAKGEADEEAKPATKGGKAKKPAPAAEDDAGDWGDDD